ncbi:MAG: hypothetical protein ACRCYY_03965 [Trueperaceae bacterium]
MNESDLILDPDIKLKLEQALGLEIPDPNSLEFQELLEELQENQPELFEEVMAGLTVNVTFPVEQQAQKAERRENFYALMTRLFFRRSPVDGEPVAAKRRWLMYGISALALIGPVLYIFSQTFGNRTPAQEALPEAVEVQPIEPVQPSAPLTAQFTPPEPPKEDPPPPPAPVKKKDPPPPPTPKKVPPPPAPMPTAPKAAPPAPAPAPVQKLPEVARATTLTIYSNDAPRPTETTLFSNDQEGEGGAPTTLSLYEADKAPDTLLLASAEREPTSLSFEGGEAAESEGTKRPSSLTFEPPAIESNGNGSGETSPEGAGEEGESSETTDEPSGEEISDENSLASLLPPGSRVLARLNTGIVVTEGAVSPVVATSGEDWCTQTPCPNITWIGEASLDPTGRVQIQFTRAVFEDIAQSISGIALGAGNTPGLNAAIKDTAPALAQDLLRSAASGVSDYVSVLSEQETVTIVDGVAVSDSDTPPLDLFLLGKMGGVFDLPQGATTVVRIAEVPVDSQLIVLFGVDSGVAQGDGEDSSSQ